MVKDTRDKKKKMEKKLEKAEREKNLHIRDLFIKHMQSGDYDALEQIIKTLLNKDMDAFSEVFSGQIMESPQLQSMVYKAQHDGLMKAVKPEIDAINKNLSTWIKEEELDEKKARNDHSLFWHNIKTTELVKKVFDSLIKLTINRPITDKESQASYELIKIILDGALKKWDGQETKYDFKYMAGSESKIMTHLTCIRMIRHLLDNLILPPKPSKDDSSSQASFRASERYGGFDGEQVEGDKIDFDILNSEADSQDFKRLRQVQEDGSATKSSSESADSDSSIGKNLFYTNRGLFFTRLSQLNKSGKLAQSAEDKSILAFAKTLLPGQY